ncbi:MAG: hypothetical protein ACOX2F_10075 [bacterium]
MPKKIRVAGTAVAKSTRNKKGFKFIAEIPAVKGKKNDKRATKKTCKRTALTLADSRCFAFLTIIGMLIDENSTDITKYAK